MSSTNSKTAILFFSRTVASEIKFKSLHDSSKNNELLSVLRNQAITTAKSSGLPIFEFNEHNQEGDSFGEKIANAFESVFSEGFDQVISIGGDCPELNFGDIDAAVSKLNGNGLVVGPDLRGGAYLIGVHRNTFDRKAFLQLAWESNRLAHSLKAYASNVETALLDYKVDLNSQKDVKMYVKTSKVFSRLLRLILLEPFCSTLLLEVKDWLHTITAHKRRGPPAFLFSWS